jgi:adenine-specific DNA-methyltransferase
MATNQDLTAARSIFPSGAPDVNESDFQIPKVGRPEKGARADVTSGRKAEFSQFFTPWPLARLMAGMFEQWDGPLHLLDAGAGSGALSAAWVEQLCKHSSRVGSAMITAFELDSALIPSLEATLLECEKACANRDIVLTWSVRNEDFIAAAVRSIQTDCFTTTFGFPNTAILNPPYRKISSSSETRRLLRSVGIEATNLYAAFVSLVLHVLAPQSEVVAITPRSFCNGPYFRPFRKQLLRDSALRRIHLFERRDLAFSEDDVLQENLIIHALTDSTSGSVTVTQGGELEGVAQVTRIAPFHEIVHPEDPDFFIHIAPEHDAHALAKRIVGLGATLKTLGIEVSTGRVVDFRARELVRTNPETNTVPLIYPQHLKRGFVDWPRTNTRKPNALYLGEKAADLVVPNETYVLVKRFSAKEETRRIVAAVYAPELLPPMSSLGIENHLNYFHANGRGLASLLARGLMVFLNSSMVDSYFRQFSGHTQVNATDLRRLIYPSRAILEELGASIQNVLPEQSELDTLLDKTLRAHSF